MNVETKQSRYWFTIHKLNNDVFTTLVRQHLATVVVASQKPKEEEAKSITNAE